MQKLWALLRPTQSICILTKSPSDLYAQKYLRCTALHHRLQFKVISRIILPQVG